MLLFIGLKSSFVAFKIVFQYISCYSLSTHGTEYACDHGVSIHLMLLFIKTQTVKSFARDSFNTSHVTLYHFKHLSIYFQKVVSIHLMLLFINYGSGEANYSVRRFNTSHVTLYPLVFPIFSLLTFFIISQNTRVCNIFPKQHRLFESFHRSTPKPYIFTTFHIFL